MIENLQVTILLRVFFIFRDRCSVVISNQFILQSEVCRLRNELAEKESQLHAKSTEKAADDELSLLNALSIETNENVLERINLQKALNELEETNVRNRRELQHLDDAIAKKQVAQRLLY